MGSHEVDPRIPVATLPFTLLANSERQYDISGARVLYLGEGAIVGVNPGDLSLALGETGPYMLIGPSDGFILTEFTRIRIRNNTILPISAVLYYSADPNFRLVNAQRAV